jgi:hypothetical protein
MHTDCSPLCSPLPPLQAHENPADHFLDIITPNISDSVEDLAAREKKIGDSYASIAPVVSSDHQHWPRPEHAKGIWMNQASGALPLVLRL